VGISTGYCQQTVGRDTASTQWEYLQATASRQWAGILPAHSGNIYRILPADSGQGYCQHTVGISTGYCQQREAHEKTPHSARTAVKIPFVFGGPVFKSRSDTGSSDRQFLWLAAVCTYKLYFELLHVSFLPNPLQFIIHHSPAVSRCPPTDHPAIRPHVLLCLCYSLQKSVPYDFNSEGC